MGDWAVHSPSSVRFRYAHVQEIHSYLLMGGMGKMTFSLYFVFVSIMYLHKKFVVTDLWLQLAARSPSSEQYISVMPCARNPVHAHDGNVYCWVLRYAQSAHRQVATKFFRITESVHCWVNMLCIPPIDVYCRLTQNYSELSSKFYLFFRNCFFFQFLISNFSINIYFKYP